VSEQLDSADPDDVVAAAEVCALYFARIVSSHHHRPPLAVRSDGYLHGVQFLFERAHTSHMRSGGNKDQMRMQGAIPALFRTLRSQSDDARSHAHTFPCQSAKPDSLPLFLPPSLSSSLHPFLLRYLPPSLAPSRWRAAQHGASAAVPCVCVTQTQRNESSKARCGADVRNATPHS
jgi:hypothetical protein